MKPTADTSISSLGVSGALSQKGPLALQYELSNSTTKVTFHLPDPVKGFYRGTRFDWSGMIAELESQGHIYFGKWFSRVDPGVRDFTYHGSELVVGPCTGATGPAEEFMPLGYDEAKPGETFVKIGVGVLRKPDDRNYDLLRLYDIVDSGKWRILKESCSLEFTQDLDSPSLGYAYKYQKTMELSADAPVLFIKHRLTNNGKRAIRTQVYDHNFLVMDHQPPGPDFAITFPFHIVPVQPPEKDIVELRGNQIVFLKGLTGEDRVYGTMGGFSETPADYNFSIENARLGASLTISGDRALKNLAAWAIPAVLSIEPFVEIAVEPGQAATWAYQYTFRNLNSS